VLIKASLIFVLLNLSFALLDPLDQLGKISIYNWLVPGRERLPYGEQPEEDYNLSLNNIPSMLASHNVSKSKEPDEFRVIVIGDSGTWGWLLENDETLTGQLNSAALLADDGRKAVFYNLAYPVMSVTKDLLLLARAMEMDPDLILWPITLQSMIRSGQLDHPLLQNNASEVRELINEYELALDPNDNRLVDPEFLDKTIIGQRRDLADLIRLQLYGPTWAATGVDQAISNEITLRRSDFEADVSWADISQPVPLTSDHLTWEVIEAGVSIAGQTPIWIINEPIFISQGENSDLRYNAWYPRWAYDEYRQQLNALAAFERWQFVDMWDSIAPAEFTDSPLHLTPEGTTQVADSLIRKIIDREEKDEG
jgi:lysophospholipase L1-like esterase